MKQDTTKLQTIANELSLNSQDLNKLVEAFGGPFNEVGAILDDYKLDESGTIIKTDKVIVVKDVNDKEGMLKAREARLLLKKARTTVENKRKELKEDIVKQGKAIDKIAKFVKEEIVPVENYLQHQEDYAKVIAEAERLKLKNKRVEDLLLYTDDISLYNLDDMTDEQFGKLLETVKDQYEYKVAEAKRVEEERIQKERAEAEERARIEEENQKLKAEAEERAKADAEKQRAEKLNKEAEEREKRYEAERISEIRTNIKLYAHNLRTVYDCDEAAVSLDAYYSELTNEDRDNEVIQSIVAITKTEIKEIKTYIIEQLEITKREEEQRLQEERQKQELLAPDKDKLIAFAKGIDTVRKEKMPAVKSKQAQDILNEVELHLSRLFNYIMDATEEM